MGFLSLLGQTTTTSDAAGAGLALVFVVVWIAFLALFLIGYWKVFTKMGLPGWMGIIPFVNVYMLFKARGEHEPVVFLILCMIPCVNIIGLWFLANDTAEVFDKEIGWKIFLFLLPGISHLVLGFGDSQANPRNIAPGVGLNEQNYAG
ncbi:MAG: DUF5684 domain-containing protein [Microthrixaceae bacterium]